MGDGERGKGSGPRLSQEVGAARRCLHAAGARGVGRDRSITADQEGGRAPKGAGETENRCKSFQIKPSATRRDGSEQREASPVS